MAKPTNRFSGRYVVLAVFAFAYFLIFPQDWSAILSLVERVLAISNGVSPWLYAVLGVALVCWTMIRIWGREAGEEAGQAGAG